jgi:taurine--2-oxoglutarate transaminase
MAKTEKIYSSKREEILSNNLKYTLFSWSKQKGIDPICVEKAEGVYLYDYNGKRYLDFSSGLMNVNIGHGDQRVTDAVVKQMQQFSYITPSCASEVRGELGKKLAQICPGNLNKAFFTLSGAGSIENAIKLARHYTGRHKIIARYRAFHGATYAAMTAGGDPRKLPSDSQQVPNIVHVEDAYCYRCPWSQDPRSCKMECISHVDRIIDFEGPGNIAAILMEGESGTSGCIKYPPNYWKRLREICDRHGILLIADEVMSGFGRTGKWFGFENHGVVPDMVCMAKGITSGYLPFGCLMVTDSIAAKYDHEPLMIGLTYSAHATACAAALEVINIYETDHLVEKAAKMGEYVNKCLDELKSMHPCIGDFRNTGLLGCIELVKNRATKEPIAPYNAPASQMLAMNQVANKLKELGLYTFVRWNYLFIAPPLTITEAQIDEGLSKISEALNITDEQCIM